MLCTQCGQALAPAADSCATCGPIATASTRPEPPPISATAHNPYAPPDPNPASLAANAGPVDFASLKFDPNHKRNSAALEAARGLRLILVSIALNLLAFPAAILAVAAGSQMPPGSTNVLFLVVPVLIIAAFAVGAYGIYSMMDGLGWAGYINFLLIGSLLVPYLKFVTLLLVSIKTLTVMKEAGYRFTLFGEIRKSR